MTVPTRRHVPLLDLSRQHADIGLEVEQAVLEAVRSQKFILGPAVEKLEAEVAAYCACRFGVGMSSGTDALLACLMAEGIGPGDEVVVPDYSFFATAGAVSRVGARPVFVDIHRASYNLDPALVEKAITPRTKAVIPVHLFGQMAEMDPIMEVATSRRLVVIEDAAQAIGAEYQGRRAGSIGHYGCLSFFPSKNLGGLGDGGMVVTNEPDRADRLRMFRAHGARPKYYHHVIGGNFRLDTIQAAALSVKLKCLDGWTARRQANAAAHRAALSGYVGLPSELPARRHIYNQFVIRAEGRDGLRTSLKEAGVDSEVYYPVPFHRQPCFSDVVQEGTAFPESERAAAESLALPVFPELTVDELWHVSQAVAAWAGRASEGVPA